MTDTISFDFNDDVTLGTVTGSEFTHFKLPFPSTSDSLERYVTLEITFDSQESAQTRLILPLYIDFEYAPDSVDYVRIPIIASNTPVGKRGAISSKAQSREIVIAAIQSLIGTITTLVMDEGNTTWTVFVEDYTTQETSDTIQLQSGECIVEVLLRRLP